MGLLSLLQFFIYLALDLLSQGRHLVLLLLHQLGLTCHNLFLPVDHMLIRFLHKQFVGSCLDLVRILILLLLGQSLLNLP